jgi:mono/diheme cytochrome c family protein
MPLRTSWRALALSASVLAVAAFAACSSPSSGAKSSASTGTPPPASSYAAPAATMPPASSYAAPAAPSSEVASQIARGQQLFASNCAKCHGAAGEGSAQAPAVIGGGALPSNPPAGRRLRTGAFHSAKDVGMFIKDNMPPGSHTPPDQTGAILAYLMQSNGVTVSQPMNPTSAASIPLNR